MHVMARRHATACASGGRTWRSMTWLSPRLPVHHFWYLLVEVENAEKKASRISNFPCIPVDNFQPMTSRTAPRHPWSRDGQVCLAAHCTSPTPPTSTNLALHSALPLSSSNPSGTLTSHAPAIASDTRPSQALARCGHGLNFARLDVGEGRAIPGTAGPSSSWPARRISMRRNGNASL